VFSDDATLNVLPDNATDKLPAISDLADDNDVIKVLKACDIDIEFLKQELEDFIKTKLKYLINR